MRILVTGGAGFIGTNFVHYWSKKYPKDKIRVIDALTFAGNIENLKPLGKKVEFVKGDICDREKVSEALKGVDALVHFAAESHVDRSIFDPARFWNTNVEGTKILLEEAKKAKILRFHHISTDEVYGELPLNSTERFSEKTPYAPRPDNIYAVSKAEADKVVRDFYRQTGMFVTISNCSNNYGPYQFPEKYIPILVTNLIDGYKAPVHGDGQNVRDWIHTEDHARAVDLILRKGKAGETYLIGANNDLPNKYIAQRVVYLYGKDESWIRYVPDRHSNDRRYAIDATKIIEELGWKPQVSRENFDDGLKETIDWYKKNEDWWRPLLRRRAVISDGENKVFAFISLDRETGKTRLKIDKKKEAEEKKENLEERFLKQDERRFLLIKDKLKSRDWFKNSGKQVRKKLLKLAKNVRASGFIEDLANRPDVVESLKQLKLIKVEYSPEKYPIYGIAAWFEVEASDGTKRAEAYYGWGLGTKSGVKFLVLIRYKGRISHLALVKEEKFPVGAKVYGLAGGFPKVNESVFELILRKLREDLGIDVKSDTMAISEIVGLGRVMPDAGMTPNRPLLYAVEVEVKERIFPPLRIGEIYDASDEVVLWPVEKLTELVNKVDDAYLLSALSRLTLGGVSNFKLE